MTTAVSAYAATSCHRTAGPDQDQPPGRRPNDVASTSSSRVSATPTSTPCEASGATPTSRWSPATRSPVSSPRSARGHQVRSATGSASAASSTPAGVRLLPRRRGAVLRQPGGMVGTYNGVGRDGQPTQGGYSGAIVVDENYVLRIPDAIPLDAAAPLLCAGITTYSPLGTGTRAPASRSRSSASAVSAHGGEACGRDGRRGHRAQPDAEEDGGRAAARRRPSTTPPATATPSRSWRAGST